MAEYQMQEMNLPDKDGKRVLYPRIILSQRVDTASIAKMLSQSTTFTVAEVIGLLQGLADQISNQMSYGRSVKLDGIGTFTPSLTLRKGKERETGEEGSVKRNAQSIRVGDIHFRPEKTFISNTNRQCVLERSQHRFVRSSQKYTPDQRLEMARQYLSSHPYLRIADYAALTGLRHTAASLELKQWSRQPESGISASGRGTHKVYIMVSD
ncbi:MAG: HU family DNA-binding protein [Tannerella sp.]|jgi:predicted histone-like DNA-binding protein|nr:HU family DNA-binding protein [Tannerella sp.]